METTTRERLYKQIDAEAWEGSGISPLNLFVLGLVLFSVVIAVLQSERTLQEVAPGFFDWTNWFLAVAFSIEYGTRLWIMERASASEASGAGCDMPSPGQAF